MFKNQSVLADLKAGVVVFLVALPLCLGIALAQGAPPLSGIITGAIGGLVVTLISGSRLSVSGPANGVTAVVAIGIVQVGGYENFLLALFLAGIFQILFGILRTGIISHYFPSSVIKGMLSAIGIILIMKQIPHLAGDDADPEGDMFFFQPDGRNTFTELIEMFRYAEPGPLLIGSTALLLIFVLTSTRVKDTILLKYIPAPLIVVIVGILMNLFFSNYYPVWAIKPEHLVQMPKITDIDTLLRNLKHPDFTALNQSAVWVLGLTIAAIASIETLLSLDALDKMDPKRTISPSNRELMAQGTGNLLCGLVGGIPLASVIVRSSANVNAGGQTKLSVAFHAVLMLFFVVILPEVLSLIPIAALASILLYTGYKLTTLTIFRTMYNKGLSQFLPFIVTIVVMLATDILRGIAAGMMVSVFYILKNNLKTPYKVSSSSIDGKVYTLITLSEDVTFLNKNSFREVLNSVPPDSEVIFDGHINKTIDMDVADMINEFRKKAHEKDITVELISLDYLNY